MFIQVRHYNSTQLAADLDHVYEHHRGQMKLLLNEIGDTSLHPNVNVIAPYLPGGPKAAFSEVFVGSSYVPWTGSGSGYREGMLDSGHRWANLYKQRDLWDAWVAAQGVPDGFYVDHEGVLNLFDEWDVRAAYTAYLIQSCRDAHTRAADIPVLWSPAIWSGTGLTGSEESGFARALTDIKLYAGQSGHPGITHLYLQDMMGRDRDDITKEDVKQWWVELVRAHTIAGLFQDYGINAEWFKTVDGQLYAADPSVMQARLDWYANEGIPVKTGWELRWWMGAHVDAIVPPPDTTEARIRAIMAQATEDIVAEL